MSYDFDTEIPSAEEMKNSSSGASFDKTPLADGIYNCRVMKTELKRVPEYVNGVKDYSNMKLEWSCILSPVRQVSNDPLKNTKGEEVEALSTLVWKNANPYKMGIAPSGLPSNTRALFAHALRVPVDSAIKVPKVLVVNDKNQQVATEEESKEYLTELKNLQEGKLSPDKAKMRNSGFKHINDLSIIEGKYIVATIAVNGEYNKITSIGKTADSFDGAKVDAKVQDKIDKFNTEIYPRIIAKRNKGVDTSAPQNKVNNEFGATQEVEVDLTDIGW